MLTGIGYGLTALIRLFSLFLSARALLMPRPAAAGFGVPVITGLARYMAIKGSRDLAVGMIILTLLVTAPRSTVGWAVAAAALIPVVDGGIVLRGGGPKSVAFGVRYGTAAVMLVTAGLMFA